MLVYHKHLHEYATVINQTASHYAVRYDGETCIYIAPIWCFDVAGDND